MNSCIRMTALAVALAGNAAAAEPPPDVPSDAESPATAASGLSAAGLVGNGFEDGVNFGVGARLGTALQRVYLGGTFVYHFGEERTATMLGHQADVSVNIYYFGGEVGYDLFAGPLIVRPYAGLGLGTARGCIEDTCDTESRAYLAPGAAALYPLSERVFAGGDARYVIPLDDDGSDFDHLALFATLGGYF